MLMDHGAEQVNELLLNVAKACWLVACLVFRGGLIWLAHKLNRKLGTVDKWDLWCVTPLALTEPGYELLCIVSKFVHLSDLVYLPLIWEHKLKREFVKAGTVLVDNAFCSCRASAGCWGSQEKERSEWAESWEKKKDEKTPTVTAFQEGKACWGR